MPLHGTRKAPLHTRSDLFLLYLRPMCTNARMGAVTAGGELVNIRLLVGCLVLPCNQVRPNGPNLSVDAVSFGECVTRRTGTSCTLTCVSLVTIGLIGLCDARW